MSNLQLLSAASHHASGAYSNFLADKGADRVREAYPPARYRRLADVKRRYNPESVFHLNQNVVAE